MAPGEAHMSTTTTAQVACESIANAPEGTFDRSTVEAVLRDAVAAGVAPLYLDLVTTATGVPWWR